MPLVREGIRCTSCFLIWESGQFRGRLTKILSDLFGQTVFCDSPTYFLAFNSFRDARLNVVEIPVDENGINVDIIEEHLRAGKRPVMVYTVPIAHNPTGVTLSNSRRERLAELSREFNFKICTSPSAPSEHLS